MTAPIDKLLSRLEKVRKTGPNKWASCCPAHDDSSPSLNLREETDGRLLIICRAGCSAGEVVSAIGLSLADLFPPRIGAPGSGHAPVRRPFNATDLIDLAEHKSGVALVIACDILNGRPEPDLDKLREAARVLADIYEAVHADG